MADDVVLWSPSLPPAVPDSLSDPSKIVAKALQLRDRERAQIAMNIEAENFEIASSFVWMRTMALLKKQLAALGSDFIGELLQRPDIDEYTDIGTAVSDAEAISLARDLGILTPLQTLRLLHSQAIVNHFSAAQNGPASDQTEMMTRDEAISCLRVCVQGVLGHDNIGAADDFKRFRTKLEAETFTATSPEILMLESSPYFFLKTAISILLSVFKTGKGAQLEHAARNALVIIPKFWGHLRAPEKWQIGQAYAVEFSEGRQESVRALHAVLLQVSGFDFVPENLRSSTFAKVASAVISAHQGMNNFYNEPAPMRELASLGTSIPGPALAICMTAVLCVRLGNRYGQSHAAQPYAERVLAALSLERWYYYLNGRLDQDRVVLAEMTHERPALNWISLLSALQPETDKIAHKDVRALVVASLEKKTDKVSSIAGALFRRALAV